MQIHQKFKKCTSNCVSRGLSNLTGEQHIIQIVAEGEQPVFIIVCLILLPILFVPLSKMEMATCGVVV